MLRCWWMCTTRKPELFQQVEFPAPWHSPLLMVLHDAPPVKLDPWCSECLRTKVQTAKKTTIELLKYQAEGATWKIILQRISCKVCFFLTPICAGRPCESQRSPRTWGERRAPPDLAMTRFRPHSAVLQPCFSRASAVACTASSQDVLTNGHTSHLRDAEFQPQYTEAETMGAHVWMTLRVCFSFKSASGDGKSWDTRVIFQTWMLQFEGRARLRNGKMLVTCRTVAARTVKTLQGFHLKHWNTDAKWFLRRLPGWWQPRPFHLATHLQHATSTWTKISPTCKQVFCWRNMGRPCVEYRHERENSCSNSDFDSISFW